MKRLLLFLMVAALPASATVRFLNSGASGSGNGSTWVNAYTTTTAMNTASSGWAAGDTLCIAGAVYGGQGIVTGHAGTSGNQIVYKRASASDSVCGSTTAGWSSGFDALVTITNGALIQNSFVTIEGTVANGLLMPVSNTSGDPSAIGVNAPTSGVIIRNIEISEPGCGTSGCNQNGDSRAIDMNHFNGSTYDLQTNWLIEHDYLHGQCTIIWSAHSTGLIIQYTKFADSADNTPGNPNCHPNVMATQDTAAGTFRYNEVTNWQVEGMMTCPNGACAANWDIYGNVWHDPMAGSFPRVYEAQGSTCATVHAYNNTIVGVSFATFTTANSGCYAGGSQGRNNIYISSSGSGLPSNDFDACNGSTCGETNGQNIATSIFVNFSAKTVAGYALASNTAAGTTLSSPFNTDLNGTTRGSNGTWDRGYYQIPTTSQTWFVRADGGTRVSTNVPSGLCDGLSDLPAAGAVAKHCAFGQYRYMWDDGSGVCPLGCAGSWVIAGGDTVVVRGCTNTPTPTNPVGPACRIGWDGPTGATSNNWSFGIGNQDAISPPIPAGTAVQHTRILSDCALAGNCTPIDYAHWPYTGNNLQELVCGFGLVRGCFNLKSTQYVDVVGFTLDSHNAVTSGNPGFPGNCTFGGAPAYPVSCANNQPLDDYAQNGFVTESDTANILLQDINIHGFNASALWGPIGGPFTMIRVNASFNGFAGWNFADASDTPNAAGSQIIASNVTMNGNGCYEKYPLTGPNLLWPARACYDDISGGFGDAWSGQDTTLDTFTLDHGVMLYNTKDAFIGPHAQVGNLTVTNTVSIGNMGAQMKYGSKVSANVLFQNDLFVMNCGRQSEQLPNAVQNFALTTGLGGSYLSDFCRAGGDGWAFLTRATSTNHFYGITLVGANATMMDINCGFVDSGGVHEETNCNTSPLIWKDLNVLGYTPPFVGAQPGLWFFDPGAGGSLVLTADHNNYFGVRNISPDVCGTNNITCVDPQLASQPSQTWVSEAALDVFNPFAGAGNSFYPTSGSPLRGAGTTVAGLTTDFYATTRPSPPGLGGAEFVGGAPTLVSMAVTPNPGAVNVSSTLAMTCTSTFSDSSTAPCSSPVWTDTAVHSSINSSTGVVTGVSAGSDTVTATISAISGNATVNVSALPVVATPTASPVAGTYTSTQSVTLSTVTSGSTICYTIDGSTPTAPVAGTCSGGTTQTYSTPISVAVTKTIKAIGTHVGDTNSGLFTGLYTITPPATGVHVSGSIVFTNKMQ